MESVPLTLESQDGERGEGGIRVRQDDLPERPESARTVDGRGLLELLRQGLEELRHEEDAEHFGEIRQRDPGEVIDEAELIDDEELWHPEHLTRDHDAAEDREEQYRRAGEAQPRE